MFAILAINILGDKLGYCNVPEDELYYGISKTQVFLKTFAFQKI